MSLYPSFHKLLYVLSTFNFTFNDCPKLFPLFLYELIFIFFYYLLVLTFLLLTATVHQAFVLAASNPSKVDLLLQFFLNHCVSHLVYLNFSLIICLHFFFYFFVFLNISFNHAPRIQFPTFFILFLYLFFISQMHHLQFLLSCLNSTL